LIKLSVTWGVTALPLKRNLVPRFERRSSKEARGKYNEMLLWQNRKSQ
jgi:hypothetical protein